jgi:hypothetical protein
MKAPFFVTAFFMFASLAAHFAPFPGGGDGCFSPLRSAYGEENWKKEFEEICGNTDDSMKLSQDELKKLIAGCDRLRPAIESLEETPRKVYLKRLQMCRGLLIFVLESKEKR